MLQFPGLQSIASSSRRQHHAPAKSRAPRTRNDAGDGDRSFGMTLFKMFEMTVRSSYPASTMRFPKCVPFASTTTSAGIDAASIFFCQRTMAATAMALSSAKQRCPSST